MKKREKSMPASGCSATEGIEKADLLFAQAIKYKDKIRALSPLSGSRLIAESDYTKTLNQAHQLFMQAHKNSSNPVIKQHAQLRLEQIKTLARRDGLQKKICIEPRRPWRS